MRKLVVSTSALLIALSFASGSALAARTTRTDQAPAATAPAEQHAGYGRGFYTCLHVMYTYGRGRYGGRVSDDAIFQAAHDVCFEAY